MASLLAIECGGTHLRAGLYDESGICRGEFEGQGANVARDGIEKAVEAVARAHIALTNSESDVELVLAIAGGSKPELATALANRIVAQLAVQRAVVSSDIEPVLWANLRDDEGVLVVSGTGSIVVALRPDGRRAVVGGRGVAFGDPGSGYAIGRRAFSLAAAARDGYGATTELVEALPDSADVTGLDDLSYLERNGAGVAYDAFAETVSMAATAGDPVATDCLRAEAATLAEQCFAAAQAVELSAPGSVVCLGGVIEGSTIFRDTFERLVGDQWESAAISIAPIRGHEAVSDWYRAGPEEACVASRHRDSAPTANGEQRRTELRNDDALIIDASDIRKILGEFLDGDRRLIETVARTEEDLHRLLETTIACFTAGGRIIYAGAGTSGRLGVLDASECHPTFGVPEGRVVGIIAGGDRALRHSIEGAEDDEEQAARDLDALNPSIGENDILIGLTASGTTPYVLSMLRAAESKGARTAIIACNPVPDEVAQHRVFLNTGPEILPGSTRLKAGTATKLVLNMISTITLAKCGYVYEGYMVGVTPTNIKLRARAIRILSALLETDAADAEIALDAAGSRIPIAVLMRRMSLDRDAAEQKLDAAKGSLRDALGE